MFGIQSPKMASSLGWGPQNHLVDESHEFFLEKNTHFGNVPQY